MEARRPRAPRLALSDLPDDCVCRIGGCLVDVLEPVLLVNLGSACKGLRRALKKPLEELKAQHHAAAEFLFSKLRVDWLQFGDTEPPPPRQPPLTCKELRTNTTVLDFEHKTVTDADMATFARIIRTNGLCKIEHIEHVRGITASGMSSLCASLGANSLPALTHLSLSGNRFGSSGAESLARALDRGALRSLTHLYLDGTGIGDDGAVALAKPLQKLPSLGITQDDDELWVRALFLNECEIGDRGATALLLDDLADGDFESLSAVSLERNRITDAFCDKFIAALEIGGGPPSLQAMGLHRNLLSGGKRTELHDALATRTPKVRSAIRRARAAEAVHAAAEARLAAARATAKEVNARVSVAKEELLAELAERRAELAERRAYWEQMEVTPEEEEAILAHCEEVLAQAEATLEHC